MVTSEHPQSGQNTWVTVTRTTAGWEVREQDGQRVVRTAKYRDWHRVERAVEMFKLRTGVEDVRVS